MVFKGPVAWIWFCFRHFILVHVVSKYCYPLCRLLFRFIASGVVNVINYFINLLASIVVFSLCSCHLFQTLSQVKTGWIVYQYGEKITSFFFACTAFYTRSALLIQLHATSIYWRDIWWFYTGESTGLAAHPYACSIEQAFQTRKFTFLQYTFLFYFPMFFIFHYVMYNTNFQLHNETNSFIFSVDKCSN